MVGTYASFLLFGLPGLVVALARRDRSLLRTAYPFGPSMLVGAVVGVVDRRLDLGPSRRLRTPNPAAERS